MKVPLNRTPRTNVVALQEGYGRAAPSLDISPITKPLQQFGKELEKARDDAEEFDLQTRLIQETNELQADLEERKLTAEPGAPEFAESTLNEYQTRHEKMLGEYWKKGYSRKALQNFAVRLGALRQHVGGEALTFQADSTMKHAGTQLDQLTLQVSQYAAGNPDAWNSAKEELRAAHWKIPGLTEAQREAYFERNLSIARQGAAKAYSLLHPDRVISSLDPNGITAPPKPAVGGAYQQIAAAVTGLDPDRTEVAATLITGNLPTVVVAGFLGNFDVEAGYGGAQGDGGSASGIAQWRKERRDAFRAKYGKDPHEATKAEQAAFVLHEMQNPREAGMTVKQRDAILAAKTAEEAATLIDKFYERSTGVHRKQRIEAAKGYEQSAQAWIAEGRAPAPATETVTGAMQLAPEQADKPLPTSVEEAQTGIAILDDLNGAERLQVLGWAREKKTQNASTLEGAMDVVVANAVAAVGLDGYAGPMPTKEQFSAAYENPIEAEQKWAQFSRALQANQVVQRIRTLTPEQIQAEVNKLQPKSTSPTLAVDKTMYEAALEAQTHIMKARTEDPAAYVLQTFPDIGQQLTNAKTSAQRREAYSAMERAFDKLGIPERERVYLTDAAVEEMADQFKTGDAKQRRGMIETWLHEMGGREARMFGRGKRPEGADQAVALYRTLNNRNLFLQVMEGQDIINKDPARKPAPGTINMAFRGNAYGIGAAINNLSGEVSLMYNDASAALYVRRGGTTANGLVSDADLYQAALKEVVGDIYTDNDRGKVQDVTILPHGVTAKEFEHWKDSIPGDLYEHSVSGWRAVDKAFRPIPLPDLMENGVFVQVAPNLYGVKSTVDGKFIKDQSGQRFLIRLDRRAMGLR